MLAKAGFFYAGQADRVRCAFCGGTLRNWQHGDDPAAAHRNNFGLCPFIRGQDVRNVPLPPQPPPPQSARVSASGSNPSSSAVTPTEHRPCPPQGEDIGPEAVRAPVRLDPRHPDMQSVDSRLDSFAGWPEEAVHRPWSLVEAGFYYTGRY